MAPQCDEVVIIFPFSIDPQLVDHVRYALLSSDRNNNPVRFTYSNTPRDAILFVHIPRDVIQQLEKSITLPPLPPISDPYAASRLPPASFHIHIPLSWISRFTTASSTSSSNNNLSPMSFSDHDCSCEDIQYYNIHLHQVITKLTSLKPLADQTEMGDDDMLAQYIALTKDKNIIQQQFTLFRTILLQQQQHHQQQQEQNNDTSFDHCDKIQCISCSNNTNVHLNSCSNNNNKNNNNKNKNNTNNNTNNSICHCQLRSTGIISCANDILVLVTNNTLQEYQEHFVSDVNMYRRYHPGPHPVMMAFGAYLRHAFPRVNINLIHLAAEQNNKKHFPYAQPWKTKDRHLNQLNITTPIQPLPIKTVQVGNNSLSSNTIKQHSQHQSTTTTTANTNTNSQNVVKLPCTCRMCMLMLYCAWPLSHISINNHTGGDTAIKDEFNYYNLLFTSTTSSTFNTTNHNNNNNNNNNNSSQPSQYKYKIFTNTFYHIHEIATHIQHFFMNVVKHFLRGDRQYNILDAIAPPSRSQVMENFLISQPTPPGLVHNNTNNTNNNNTIAISRDKTYRLFSAGAISFLNRAKLMTDTYAGPLILQHFKTLSRLHRLIHRGVIFDDNIPILAEILLLTHYKQQYIKQYAQYCQQKQQQQKQNKIEFDPTCSIVDYCRSQITPTTIQMFSNALKFKYITVSREETKSWRFPTLKEYYRCPSCFIPNAEYNKLWKAITGNTIPLQSQQQKYTIQYDGIAINLQQYLQLFYHYNKLPLNSTESSTTTTTTSQTKRKITSQYLPQYNGILPIELQAAELTVGEFCFYRCPCPQLNLAFLYLSNITIPQLTGAGDSRKLGPARAQYIIHLLTDIAPS